MIRNITGICILSLIAGIACAQEAGSPSKTGERDTQAQGMQLKSTAHTLDQYKALADYYATQRDSFALRASEEKKEMELRSRNITGIQAKYPRPVDSARNLYDYYMYKASAAGALEARYSQLASPGVLAQR